MTQWRPAASPSLIATTRASPSRTFEQRTDSYSASRGAKRFALPSSGYTTTGAGPPGRAASAASFSCSSGTADLSCTCTLSEK